VAVVEEDPDEQGRRALLNLGHTFGHAIEQASGYGLRHGEAVAVGICAAATMAQNLGLCEAELPGRIVALFERLGLPTTVSGLDRDRVVAAMGMDKKRAGKTLRFVLPIALGDCRLVDSPGDAQVQAALESVLLPAPSSPSAGGAS
jgi:3-dehydroquinate synthetase